MREKFAKNAFCYCRVSTPKQAQEGEGLTDQEKATRFVADRIEANVVRVWSEPFSGSEENRPIFDEMKRAIKSSPIKIDFVIIRDIDRLTRGGAAIYQKMKAEFAEYGCEIVDSYGLIQPMSNTLAHLGFEYSWSKFSPSGMAETLKAENAKDEKRIILTRLMGAEIKLTQEGYHLRRPTDGFINAKTIVDGKKRPIEIPDPERAHYFIEMFKLRSLGRYTDEEIIEKINAMGFKTREFNLWNKTHTKIIGKRGGIPLTVKQLQRTVQKTKYCGVCCEKWTNNKPVKAKFDGLVSIELFNKANKGKVFIKENGDDVEMFFDYLPDKVIQKRSKDNPLYPYKETILCPYCKKPFLGSASPGKSKQYFPTYHCSRNHKYLGINKKIFDSTFEAFIRSLNFNKEKLPALKIALRDIYNCRSEEIINFGTRVENNIVVLKHKQAEAIEAFKKTSSPILQKKFENEIEELELEISKAKNQKPIERINEYDIDNFFKSAEYLMEHPEELLLNKENQPTQKRLLSLVFDEQPTWHDILNGTPKISFIFAKTKEPALAGSLNVALRGIEPLFTG